MCKKYGIDTLFSKEQYPHKVDEDWLNDKQLFEYASKNDANLRPPFISFILTSSMHSPYIKSYEKYNIKYPEKFSSELKHYLDNVHYMDKYFGQYLKSIKQQPWYDNCTIIITADHKPNGPKLNVTNEHLFSTLPLIIAHSGQSHIAIGTNHSISQTSIFPTVLDLFHICTNNRGVGTSIFMPDSIRKLPYEQERSHLQQITSNYIINNYYIK